MIAGSRISSGIIRQGELVLVKREGATVGRGRIETLNLRDTTVAELNEVGIECGIKLDAFDLFEDGDVIEVVQQQATTHSIVDGAA